MPLDIDTNIGKLGDSDIGSGIARNIGHELGSIDIILAVVSAAIWRVVSAVILDRHIHSAAQSKQFHLHIWPCPHISSLIHLISPA